MLKANNIFVGVAVTVVPTFLGFMLNSQTLAYKPMRQIEMNIEELKYLKTSIELNEESKAVQAINLFISSRLSVFEAAKYKSKLSANKEFYLKTNVNGEGINRHS